MIPYPPKIEPFHLMIVSPEKTVFEGEVHFALFPGKQGDIGVLRDHLPLFSELRSGGLIETWVALEKQVWNVDSGFVSVESNLVYVVLKDNPS